MRVLVTNAVRLCQVLTTQSWLMHVFAWQLMDSPSTMHQTQTLVAVNEIHNLIVIFLAYLPRVTVRERLDRAPQLPTQDVSPFHLLVTLQLLNCNF